MSDLSLEIRAERAARRRNKKIAARFPLFADQFAVTPESQAERLVKQDASNVIYSERLKASVLRKWEEAQEYKEIARQFLSEDLFTNYEARYQRIYGSRGEYSKPEHVGHFAADWWWCALRDHDVSWCWEHCGNESYHSRDWYRLEGRCPTCHKPLLPPEQKPAELIQTGFIHTSPSAK